MLAVASVVAGFVLWQLVGMVLIWRKDIPFPLPVPTLLRLWRMALGEPLLEHSLWRHVADSLQRWWIGFAIGTLIGLALAAMAGLSSILERLIMPAVYTLQLVPCVAWIPVALLLFGVGSGAAIFMSVIAAVTPIAINVLAGIKSVNPAVVRAAQMCGVRGPRMFTWVLLPACLPHVISGLRVGIASSWRLVVAGEMIVGTATGLGYSILQARWTLDYQAAFACVLVIALIGMIAEWGIFARLEQVTLRRWGVMAE